MKRRLISALAGLALLLSVAAGAVAAEVDGAAGLAVLTNGTINVDSGGDRHTSVAIHVIRNDDGTDSVALAEGEVEADGWDLKATKGV